MKLFKEILIAVAGISLTIVFEFIELVLVHPMEADLDPNQVFCIQFDLVILALSLLVGAHFSTPKDKRGPLSLGFIVLFVCTLLILCSAAMAGRHGELWTWVRPHVEWLTIWIPDTLGAIAAIVAVNAVRRISE